MKDAFSVSGFFRWNRYTPEVCDEICAKLEKVGGRFLAADSELVSELPEHPEKMKICVEIAAKHHLTFRDAHSPWGEQKDLTELTEEPMIRYHLECLNVLGEYGVKTYTIHPGGYCCYRREWLGNEDKFRSIAARALEKILKTAEKNRIIVCVENIFEPSSYAPEAVNLIHKFSSPYVGLCYDCGHANLMEPMAGRDVTKMVGYIQDAWKPGIPDFRPNIVDYMLPDIVTVHQHDNDGLTDSHALIDEHGTIDWKRVCGSLKKAPRLVSIQSEAGDGDILQVEKAQVNLQSFWN